MVFTSLMRGVIASLRRLSQVTIFFIFLLSSGGVIPVLLSLILNETNLADADTVIDFLANLILPIFLSLEITWINCVL